MKKVITLLVLFGIAAYAQEAKEFSFEIAELEREGKKWQNEVKGQKGFAANFYNAAEGQFFSFEETERYIRETGAVVSTWTATSKMKMGNCPAKSVWKMEFWGEEGIGKGDSEIPPKCKSITPKAIIDYINYEFNEFE